MPIRRLPFSAFLICFLVGCLSPASAVIRDGGIDTKNMGKGTWIYILPNAVNNLGGNVPSVNSLSNLMTYMKNKGMQYVIVKAAQGDSTFNGPQFTPAVVEAGHAAGLKVFGYIYTTGENVPGEIAMCNWIFQQGADGLVYDAEGEWESTTGNSQVGGNGPALATQLCSNVRSNWPNKFMGLSTWPYRGVHTTLPYKEFAYYCDVIMPQVYWLELDDSPTVAVTTMNSQWNSWKTSLTGIWTNAIKPFIVSGQGWNSSGTNPVTVAQIVEFENALKTIANPVSPGGFKAVDYWRAELHPASIWPAFVTNLLALPYTNAPIIQYVPAVDADATNAIITWPTDQVTDAAVEYGVTAAYGNAITNSGLLWYHTVNLTGLSPNTTYHFRVKSKGTNNLTGVSPDYVFTTTAVTVPDTIIDNPGATVVGTWSTGNSSPDKFGADYRFRGNAGAGANYLQFTPSLAVAGSYQVYEWHPIGGNRTVEARHAITYNGGTQTLNVNQQANGGQWNLLGAFNFAAGAGGYVRITDGHTDTGQQVLADGIKFVYVPPAPTKPSIAAQPQPQTVNQGNSATFTVVAGGTAVLTYQWKHAGTNLPGATTSTYLKNNVQPVDAGNYSVGITNGIGFSNSINAVLTVIVPPSITQQPHGTNVNVGSNVTFAVTATGTAPLGYQWRFNTADIAGATSSSYTKSNVQLTNAGSYSVVISNAASVVTSDDAVLTVIQPAPPHIDLVTLLPDGRFRLQISGSPGHYGIDGATNLTGSPQDWFELTNFTTTSNPFEYTDPQANLPLRFYRVKSLP